jgi:hypothetical protein
MLIDIGLAAFTVCFPGRFASLPIAATHLLAYPSHLRYSGGWWRCDANVSEGAVTRLRDLTCGSANSLGFSSVSPLLCLWTRRDRPGTARPLPALLAQGLRASLSSHPSAEPLLLGCLPRRSATLATSPGEPDLACQRGRQGSPTRAMPALSVSSAPGRSARTAAGARGTCPRVCRNDVRGPAPSNHSARFLGALLSATRLLHLLRRVLGLVSPAFLLWLVPPGVAVCPRSGSPLPAAATPGLLSPATTADDDGVAGFVMSFALVCCDRRAYFPWTPSRVGNGWVRVRPAPRCRSCGCRG